MPYTGIVLAIVAVFSAILLILIAHWLVTAGLFPRAAQRLRPTWNSIAKSNRIHQHASVFVVLRIKRINVANTAAHEQVDD